jgi:hypothetical protein
MLNTMEMLFQLLDHICRNVINGVYNKRQGGLFTIDEVNKLWNSHTLER